MSSLETAKEFLRAIYDEHLFEASEEPPLMDFSDMFKKERPRGPPKKAHRRKHRSPILKLGEEDKEEEEAKEEEE